MIFNLFVVFGAILAFQEIVANNVETQTMKSIKTTSMRESTYIKSPRSTKKTAPMTHHYNLTVSSDKVFVNNAYKYSLLVNGKFLGN